MKIKKKMRITSHFYKKRGSRTLSNRSLSQLLEIASYKKRINDLTKNNRLLTSALQESIVEAASQNSLLKNYARDINQILFARLKLNDMVKNLAKFAADLEEVQNYLNISLPAEYNFFQKKGPSNERVIKVPDVSTITEEPELSKNESLTCENSPDDVVLSNSEENATSINRDIEMTPILFISDIQEMRQKKRSSGIEKGSLTPQLNIDFSYVNQKRSTRSRSRGKTPSLGKKSSVSGRLVSHINAASTPLTHEVQDPAEIILESPLAIKNIEKESEIFKIPFQNHSNELVANGHDDCSVIQPSDLPINGNESTVPNANLNHLSELNEEVCPLEPQINENNSSFGVNHEDNIKSSSSTDEKNVNCINDEFCPENVLQKSINISQTVSSFLPDILETHEYDKEIRNVGSLTFCDSDDEDDGGGKSETEKKNTVSPRIRSSRSKKPVKYSDYILSDESDTDSPFKLAVVKRSGSGSKRVKLNSTPDLKSYEKIFDENVDEISSGIVKEMTEVDYSVYNLDVSNSKTEKKRRKKKTTSQKSKNEKVNDVPKPLFQKYSVTKFKPGKLKFSKFEMTIEKKSACKLSENLLQNSCVSPGGILKKSRPSLPTSEDRGNKVPLNETRNIDHIQDNKQQIMLQTPKRVSFAPTDLVCKFEKTSESKAVANNRKVRRTSKSAIDLKALFEEADSPSTFPTAVDNLSKKTNVRKSNNSILFDFSAETEVYALPFPSNKELTIFPVDNSTPSKPHASKISEPTKLINDENDKHVKKSPETPLHSLVLPTDDIISSETSASSISEQVKLAKTGTDKCIKKSPRTPAQCPILSPNDVTSSELSSFIICEPIKLVNKENDKGITKPLGTPDSPENKLSVKEKKILNKALSQLNSENKGKIIDIFLESPISLVKRPKRKSLFKESSDDDSKENINSNCPAPENNLLKNIISTNKNLSESTPTVDKKKKSGSKSQTRVHLKTSVKKNKKSNLEIKSFELSPVLTDSTNVLASTDESRSRRRSKQVSYKEPSLMKKLRRG